MNQRQSYSFQIGVNQKWFGDVSIKILIQTYILRFGKFQTKLSPIKFSVVKIYGLEFLKHR